MLSQLSVKNLAVVERLFISFESGMSVLTGETGAGKSILLQALNLALGQRADSNLVRHGKDKADISATFALENNQTVQHFLAEQSLDDDGECILRRIITRDGRSKAFINGNSVPLSVVRRVGDLLLDIHGQNEHQLLLRADQQMQLLDGFAHLEADKKSLNKIVKTHKTLAEKINNLVDNQAFIEERRELRTHQLNELNAAMLDQDELDTIEADFKISANAQLISEKIAAVLSQLEDESGANEQLLSLNAQLSEALTLDEKLQSVCALLDSAQVQTQESIYELTQYLNQLSTDEQSAKQRELRISELFDLSRKHQCQLAELLVVREGLSAKLSATNDAANSLDEMQMQLEKLTQDYQIKARKLSAKRRKQADELSALVTQSMQVLGMPGSAFKIGLNEKPAGVFLNGVEAIEFLVKTNQGQDFKPLKKVASGGELSRISLAISVVSSDSEYTPTLIFDEVDVGISGAVAQVVGKKLQDLSSKYQIICITHLAQVAAFAHQHLRVSKTQNAAGAQSTIEQLSPAQSVDEVARILGGAIITQKAKNAAEEMIASSQPL
jgi:DNA repair protein RecN (Recombination protein N)